VTQERGSQVYKSRNNKPIDDPVCCLRGHKGTVSTQPEDLPLRIDGEEK
jgi:hypothetical protein